MIQKKALLLLSALVIVLSFYCLSGCVHGEHDDTPLMITTETLPPGQSGSAYAYTLEAIGGKYPYTWTVEEGGSALPPGVFLSESGNLTGVPTTDGSYSFTVVVTDSDNNPRVRTKNLVVIVYPKDEVSITTGALAPAYISEAYEGQLQAVGGTPPYVWGLVIPAAELVPGLYLSESGLVTGTPTVEGISVVEVRVDDSVGGFDTRNITITVYAPQQVLTILTPSPLPDRSLGAVGDSYPFTIQATGGVLPYVWEEEPGSAPMADAGLTISANGIISKTGSPAPAEYSFSLRVTDDNGAGTAITKVYKVTVIP